MNTQRASERRINDRRECYDDYLIHPDKKEQYPCVLKNISVTGACVISDLEMSIDQIIELHICRNRDLTLRSQVVWIKKSEYGLSFMLDTPESFNTISFIINNEIHQ
jgi:hypothetical protein